MIDFISTKTCQEIDTILDRAVQRLVRIINNDAVVITTLFSNLNKCISIYKNPLKTLTITIDTASLTNEYGEATIILKTPSDADGSINFSYKNGTVINWANGEIPTFHRGCMYEISITKLGVPPMEGIAGSYFNVVAVPFSPVG